MRGKNVDEIDGLTTYGTGSGNASVNVMP